MPKMKSSHTPGTFGLVLYSKAMDERTYKITLENVESIFYYLDQAQLIKRIYFVDDSRPDLQERLLQLISSCAAKNCPDADIVQVTQNGSIYNAVNRVWQLVQEEFVLSLHYDFKMIQKVPLEVIAKTFNKYPGVYLIYLRIRGVFGYNKTAKEILRRMYHCYGDYPDDVLETWYCRDDKKRLYSMPQRLYVQQRKDISLVPSLLRGIRLIPHQVDNNNTLWTPLLPSRLLPLLSVHESFAGGPVIFRSEVIQRYLPVPKRYENSSATDCQEVYFLDDTDIDYKFYTGYLNLQAFVVPFGDPKRPESDVLPKYEEEFKKRNSVPVVQNEDRGIGLLMKQYLLKALYLFKRALQK